MQNLQSLLSRSLLLAMVYAGASTAASDRLPAQQTPLIVPQLPEVVAQKKSLHLVYMPYTTKHQYLHNHVTPICMENDYLLILVN